MPRPPPRPPIYGEVIVSESEFVHASAPLLLDLDELGKSRTDRQKGVSYSQSRLRGAGLAFIHKLCSMRNGSSSGFAREVVEPAITRFRYLDWLLALLFMMLVHTSREGNCLTKGR